MSERMDDVPMSNCLVTGGTSGIGKAAALEPARRGASVMTVGRDAGRGVGVVEQRHRLIEEGIEVTFAINQDLRGAAKPYSGMEAH